MQISTSKIIDCLQNNGLLAEVRGTLPETIDGIADDSRHVKDGYLFVAVRGSERDGHNFLGAAATAGAAVAIVEDSSAQFSPSIIVHDGRVAAAVAAAEFYED